MEQEFNPSARNGKEADQDLDYMEKVIEETALKTAGQEEKSLIILLMSLIRKKLRENPSFAQKLRELLELDDIWIKRKKSKILWLSDSLKGKERS